MIFWLTMALAMADPADFGNYHVGSATMVIQDPQRNRRLVTEVWYPALAQNGERAKTYASGATTLALRDAQPAPGPFPLIVFSHGLAAVREQATFLTEHLASHGYVVAAPDHQFNTGRDLRPFGVLRSAKDRPVDVQVVVDRMFAEGQNPDGLFFGLIDRERVAVIGHSLGGSTALAAGGAWVNAAALTNGGAAEHLDLGDARVKAVIAYMPVFNPYFDPVGLRQLEKPAMIVAGEADNVTVFEKSQQPLFREIAGPKVLAVIEGASHFNLVNEEVLAKAPWLVRGLHQPTIPRDVADAEVKRLTLSFLDYYLKGSDANLEWIRQSRARVAITDELFPSNQRQSCAGSALTP